MKAADQQLYYRLIALWAVCEGMLGGIIHGFQLPISGLIIGGSAVIIICLIAYYVPVKGAILRATLLVAIFKMMLSPHSPLPAYFAVFFQGVTGELFFLNKKYYKISCVLFATLALFESGIQRIITTTLIYGKEFWKAVNEFINGITGQDTVTNYSLYIAGGYVVLHIIAGIIIGFVAAGIPYKVKRWQAELPVAASPDQGQINEPAQIENKKRRRRFLKRSIFIIWVILGLLFLQSELKIGTPLLSSDDILRIIVRSVLILLTWYFLVSPLLTLLLKKWLAKQQQKSKVAVQEILTLIPSTRLLMELCWQDAGDKKGLGRLNKFLKLVIARSFDDHHD